MTDMLSETDPLVWSGPDTDIDEALVCRRIVTVTHDVTSFVLGSPTGRTFAFDAGQYVTVSAVIDGARVERCYTISSPSTRTDELTITVKRVPGGPMSNWLHDTLAAGDRLQVTGPMGRFATAAHPAPKYLFLSAGSGITPVMSMTRTLLEHGDAALDVVFAHSARSPRDIIFRSALERIAAAGAGVRVTTICEDAADERWDGPRGRLSLELLLAIAPDLCDREVFTCGPAPYMDGVREMLRALGADPARCHEESFDLGGTTSVDVPPTSGGTFGVQFRRSGRSIECPSGTSVLQAALQAGIPLPSSCGEGVCGTCKTTVLSGSVDMQHAGGIRPREIAAGKALLCCSTPLDDLVLDA